VLYSTLLLSLYLMLYSRLQTIGERAFYGTNLGSITLPNSLTDIGRAAFENLPNLVVELASGSRLQRIGAYAFSRSRNAFRGELTLPNSVEYIGDSAFAGGVLISSVFIGSNVRYMGGM